MLVARPLAPSTTKTAACATTDSVGDLVCISAGFTGGNYTVTKADPSDYTKMPAVGVIVSKPTATLAVVQFSLEIKEIYAALVPGRVYFVGTNGWPSAVPPAPTPGGRAYVQPVGVAVDETVLRLDPAKTMIVRTA